MGELAPPTLRGFLGTITQFAMVTGILIADLVAFPFAEEGKWLLMFAVTPVVAVIQLLLSPLLLESPRWLLTKDPKSLKARYIIKHPCLRYDHEVETSGHFVAGGARRIRTDVHCGYPERDVESTQDSIAAHLSSRPADGAAVLLESMQSFTIRLASLKA
jgi:hypothetical protein